MPDFEPGEVVLISANDPTARILHKRAQRCPGCGGAVYHCELAETGEHVDLCAGILRRRSN